jgi:GTP-binding protein
MFVDEAKVILKAGDGGNGVATFRREKYLPMGGPDGGDGGKGGDVILDCDDNISDLVSYHFQRHWGAENGLKGSSSQKNGRMGKDCILKVPPGTQVYATDEETMLAELLVPGEQVLLLKGGNGGWGNIHFKSSVNRAPRQFKEGAVGESGEFKFLLKCIADLGLVGFPNAGKSTLTGMITDAHPKTAAYPFTTLNPNIGVIRYDELYRRLRLADIPGLIQGAHENKGLGHRFLRHIERCKILVLIIDMAGTDGRKPMDDYKILLDELECYNPELLEKPRLVIANKMDEPTAVDFLKKFKRKYKQIEVIPVSCLLETGLPELKQRFIELVDAIDAVALEEKDSEE